MNGFEVEGGERMKKKRGLTPLTASGNAHGHRGKENTTTSIKP